MRGDIQNSTFWILKHQDASLCFHGGTCQQVMLQSQGLTSNGQPFSRCFFHRYRHFAVIIFSCCWQNPLYWPFSFQLAQKEIRNRYVFAAGCVLPGSLISPCVPLAFCIALEYKVAEHRMFLGMCRFSEIAVVQCLLQCVIRHGMNANTRQR